MVTPETPALSGQVFNGTKWYVAMRWCLKGMGFVSSAFLARLLMPEDFGLIGMSLVALGLITVLFNFGVTWALLQNNEATDQHFDTAWSIRLLQSMAIAVLLIISAPYLAQFYQDSRIELIVQILALVSVIKGFENIGIVKFQKEMAFAKDFKFNVLPKFLSVFVTIGLAFYYQSYMALLISMVVSDAIKVVISYLVIDFRPKFEFKKMSEIWGFSKWMLVNNFADYISQQGDLFLLSMVTSVENLGYYRWGSELSLVAITEVQQPFSRALTPAFVKLKHDQPRLTAAYLKALSGMTLVAIPIALGFGAVSQELIPIFLGGGDKWLPVVPIINALVFFAMMTAMCGISSTLLVISGHVKQRAYVSWLNAIVAVATLYPAYELFGLVGVAYSRVIVGVATFFLISYLVSLYCNVGLLSILKAIWRSLLAGLIMYVLVLNLSQWLPYSLWLVLLIKAILGAVIYISCSLIFWVISGKPSTLESDIIDKLKVKLWPSVNN